MERVRAERRADDLWANSSKIFRRLAVYVDKIVAGARPNEFPIEQPAKPSQAMKLDFVPAN